MKKNQKLGFRLISMFLAILMVVSVLPVSVFAKEATGTEVDKTKTLGSNTGIKGIGNTVFVAPIGSLTADAYQLQMGGAGSLSMEPVTDAAWNSASDSGVNVYYSLTDSAGTTFTNNEYSGGTALPSEYGAVSYAFVFYADDPSTAGKELSNVVPVGKTQSDWLGDLEKYESDPSHLVNGSLDYTELLLSELDWADASNTTLPLVTGYVFGGDGSMTIEAEAHYYSVFVKWELDGSDPIISTDNGVVYVHESTSGGSGGTGEGGGTGTGGDGGGVSTTGFVAPANYIGAYPYNSDLTVVTDVGLDNWTDASGVTFYYNVRDNNYTQFSNRPGQTALCAADGDVQFLFVYADEYPSERTVASFCPVGRTAQSWQILVANYEDAYESDHPGEEVNYAGLLGSLNWVSSGGAGLLTYTDAEVTGIPSNDGLDHYSDRYYSVFARWVKDGVAVYGTMNTAVFLHKKAQTAVSTPISAAYANPYVTGTVNLPTDHKVSLTSASTATGIDFRYSFRDADYTIFSNISGADYNPINDTSVRVEYLWTYTDGSAAKTPIGMDQDAWADTLSVYESNWQSAHPQTEIDYTDLIADLPGWTTDPALPIFDDATVYGAGKGEAGVYTTHTYSCMLRFTLLDGSGYRKAFLNNGSGTDVRTVFGEYGVVNAPVTVEDMRLRYYDVPKGIWDGVWVTMNYTSGDQYTDYILGYVLTDDFGQHFGNADSTYPDLPDNAHLEFLWNYITSSDYNGSSGLIAMSNVYPGWNATPCGMTKETWQAMIEGKTDEEKLAILASLDGWTSDNRMPVYSKGAREGTEANRNTYDECYYSCYVRIVVDDEVTGYFTDCNAAYIRVRSQYKTEIADQVYTIGYNAPESITLNFTVGVSGTTQITPHYQWYMIDTPDASSRTPLMGEQSSTLTINYENGVPFEKYYYCEFYYERGNGHYVNGSSNVARVCVTNAPTGYVDAATGGNYFFEDHHPFGTFNYATYGVENMQVVGSEGKLSALWYVVGNCSRMTWQWYETDEAGNHISTVGWLHTVNDPYEYGSDTGARNRKVNISIPCPSDEVGTKYYRVLVTNYEPGGESFACESDILTIVTLPASQYDDLYEIDENGRLTAYHGFEDEVVIPQTVHGIAVTAIARGMNAPRVVVTEGVTAIENHAFSDFYGLREIVLPSTLQTIGYEAFKRCGLTSLTIPESVRVIRERAFHWAFTDSAEVAVNAADVIVCKGAFHEARMAKLVFNSTISLTLDAIEDGENNFVVNHSIVSNYHGCFDSCPNLYFFGFPESIEVVTDEAWQTFSIYNCTNLAWVENYESIAGDYDDYGICNSQAKCLIKAGAVRIGDWIVIKDYNLEDKEYAATSCGWSVAKKLWSSETVVTLPAELGGRTVTGWGCGTHYSYGSRVIYSDLQTELGEGIHVNLTDDPETLTEVILPATLRHISDYCARGYSALTTVNFEDADIWRIGMFAFQNCPLTGTFTLSISGHKCRIGASAFEHTTLVAANLDHCILHPFAFDYCYQLETVTGNWTVETEHGYRELYYIVAPYYGNPYPHTFNFFFLAPAFPDTLRVTHAGNTPLTVENADYASGNYRMYNTGNYWYSGTPDNATLRYYVGENDTEVYIPSMIYNMDQKQAYHIKKVDWQDTRMKVDYTLTLQEGIEVLAGELNHAYEVHLPEGLLSIEPWVLSDNKLLTSITIPSTVTEIKDNTFTWSGHHHPALTEVIFAPGSQCKRIGKEAFPTSLTTINLPEGLETIGEDAFSGCTNLTSITLPSTLRSIGSSAFYRTSLTSVTFPASLLQIGENAFDSCESLMHVEIPDSVKLIGEQAFSWCSSLVSAQLPDNLTKIPDYLFENCESLTDVNIPAGCIEIGESAFRYCFSLQTIDIPFGVRKIGDRAFFETGIAALYIPASVDYIGDGIITKADKNADDPTIYIYSHSAGLPIFDWDNTPYPPSSYVQRIYGYSASGAQHFAFQYSVPFTTLPDADYRLIVITDGEGNHVGSEQVEGIRWYDEDTDTLIYAGKSVELPESMANLAHTYRCEVTFKSEFIENNIVDGAATAIFAPGETRQYINLTSRPDVTITFTPPEYYGTHFLLTVERPDGNKYYSATNTTVDDKPAFTLTTKWFPTTLTVSAENFDTLTLTDVQGDPIPDNVIDLGLIALTPNGPLLHYYIGYHATGDDTLFNITQTIPGTYTLYNYTQDRDVTVYMLFEAGTFVTITNDAANVGDALYLSCVPTSYTQKYGFEPILFTVPWANGSGELTTTRQTRGNIDLVPNGAEFYLFDEYGNDILRGQSKSSSAKNVFHVLPGTYRLLAYKRNQNFVVGKINAASVEQILGMGLSAGQLCDEEVTVVSDETTLVGIPSLTAAWIPEFKVSATANIKGAVGEYVPVTVNYSFDPSLAGVQKKVSVLFLGYTNSSPDPFLVSGGNYAWPVAGTLIGNTSFYTSTNGTLGLVVDVDSLSGSFVVYAYQESRYSVVQSAGVYTGRSVSVSTPRLEGDLSLWSIGKLPSVVGGNSTGTVALDVHHPRLANYYYFRAYKNGSLIEETPGCGYTAAIAPSKVSGTAVVKLPAENLADELNVVKYDFTVSTGTTDPAVFTFGTILYGEGADESNTRVFDQQTVTYYPAVSDVPSPIKLTINCTNNNASKAQKYQTGWVSLDGSEEDKTVYYMFYNEYYWNKTDKTTGYMNNDGILTEDMVYDFALSVFRPDLVKDATAKLTVLCGETSEDPYFTVTLKLNPVTGTFDGQLVLEGGNYTIDQMPAYFDIDFLYDISDTDTLSVGTGDIAALSIAEAEKWFTQVQQQMAEDAEAFTPIDKATFLDMMASVVPAGEEGEEILATAADLCDYQNIMAGYYASMTAQLTEQIANDEFVQAALNDGYIDPALFGDTESALEVYKELEIDADTLLEEGFTAYPGSEGGVYYLLQSEKGAAFYDPASQMMQVSSYDKNDKLAVNIAGVGTKKLMKKFVFGAPSVWYTFDEELIGYDGAAAWLRWAFENEKAYYDEQFGISARTLDDYVNKIYQKVATVKMFIDLQQETVKAFLNKMDESKYKGFKDCFDILPEEYKNSTAFAAKTNSGLSGKISKAHADALKEASELLDDMMLKLYDFREKLKLYFSGAVIENKTLSKADELLRAVRKASSGSKIAQFAKGAASGLGYFMVVVDVISGLSTIVDAYNMYLAKINGNLYNQFGWMISRLEATPKGGVPGDPSDQYKACVLTCFAYAEKLETLRGYYTAAYYKEVVSFVTSLAADIVGAINPTAGLAVGVTNWSIGNVAEIFTKGVAGKHELDADKLESRVSATCIGEKQEDPNNSVNSDGGSSGGSSKTQKKKIKSYNYIDPAGYVYEAVASNRLEGVTVTCYYKGPNGELLLWDASEAGQENPLVTDANGEYQWFVPIGEWRVVAEKDGYIISDSANDPAAVDGWLPVPPPQMEVYIPIVSTALPTVQSVQAGADYIRIEFSQYMDIDELTFYPELVSVTDNGVPVELDYTFIDREVSPTNELKYYGRILTVSRHDGLKFNGSKLKVFVDKDFYNYAGNGMAADYESDMLAVEQIAGSLSHSYPNRFAGSVGEETDIVVQLLDTEGNPMANATVSVEKFTDTLTLPMAVITDKDGRAVFHTTVTSSGYDTLTFTCGDSSVSLETYVNPIGTVKPEKPTANIEDFAVVASGTQLVLSCATEGAVIRYTINNTCPCDESALVYDGPISITEDTFVRIAAWTETGGYSERLNLHIICEKAEELSFYGASLTLQNNLKVNFYVEKDQIISGGFTDPYAVFTMNGNTVTVSEYSEVTSQGVDYYVFSFANIAPNLMNDQITATLHATRDEKDCVGEVLTYSVATYCYSMLGKTDNAKLRTLLVDLLNYGAAAQTYTAYRTDALVNDGLTAEQIAWGTAADPELTSVTNAKYRMVQDPSVNWAGVSLRLNDSVTMQFVFTTEDADGVTVRIENGEGTLMKEITAEEFRTSGGYYIAAYNGLTAIQMSGTVYATAYRGGKAISDTVAYSVESYACAKQNDANADLSALVKAMMKYGNAAYAYVH